MFNTNMTNKISVIIAGTVLAVTGITFAYQLSAHAANSSVIISDNVNCGDIKALRNNSSNFAVFFDPAHAGKKDHFEVNALLSDQQRKKLGKENSQTFSKFRLGTQPVQNNINTIKFEVTKYGKDVTNNIQSVIKNAKNMTPVNNICQ